MKEKLTYIVFAILFFFGAPAIITAAEDMTFMGAIASLMIYLIVMLLVVKRVNRYA